MWHYYEGNNWAACFGMLGENTQHLRYMREHEAMVIDIAERMFTHNTIIETEYVLDWEPDPNVNAFEDYTITQHIISKGGEIKRVPVFGYHCHQGSKFKAAVWAGAGGRLTGRYTSIFQVLKTSIKIIYGGLKRTFRTDCNWFTSYAIKQGFGLLWGYYNYKKYLKKQI